jgi:hypothetical protein
MEQIRLYSGNRRWNRRFSASPQNNYFKHLVACTYIHISMYVCVSVCITTKGKILGWRGGRGGGGEGEEGVGEGPWWGGGIIQLTALRPPGEHLSVASFIHIPPPAASLFFCLGLAVTSLFCPALIPAETIFFCLGPTAAVSSAYWSLLPETSPCYY